MRIQLQILLFLGLFATFSVHGKEFVSAIDKDIDSLCRKLEVVGLELALIRDSNIVYSYTYGKAIKRDNSGKYFFSEFNRKSDLWKVASLTKNIIATAIMQLEEKGLLSIYDDANKYLPFKLRNPSFPNDIITIQMLLSNHSSILNDRYERKDYPGVQYSSVRPGTEYIYSNINYLLLASIIENITKESFDKYIINNIFEPLEISGYFYPYNEIKDRLVYGKWMANHQLSICDSYQAYRHIDKESYRICQDTKSLDPAGGLIISLPDMVKYVKLCMGNSRKIIKDSTLQQMRLPQSDKAQYGLGTIDYSGTIKGENLYGHTGYAYGIYTCMVYNPERKYGIVIFCNGLKINYQNAFLIIYKPIITMLHNKYIMENHDSIN